MSLDDLMNTIDLHISKEHVSNTKIRYSTRSHEQYCTASKK